MRIAPRSSRFAIFSCRALTASATEAASADKSSGPPVVARNPTWLGSTKIEIVMATTNAQGLRLPLLYSISQVMRSESARPAESGTGRKRDRYDIDKMGSFGLWFGDATNSAGRSWWNGFSRFKSRRGANAVVQESGRLPSIRAGFAGYSFWEVESGTGTILTRWGVL